jgi:hypothetical protein
MLKKKRIVKSIENITKEYVYNKLNSNLEIYYDIMMELYERELNGAVTDRKSKSRPEDYMDLFFERLQEDTVVEMTEKGVLLSLPDMETFNFNGLDPIRHILEGTPGKYVEMSVLDFETVFGAKASRFIKPERILNPEATKKKDKYVIVPFSGKIDKAQKRLRKRFVVFPFSNVPPIRLLEKGNDIVKKEVYKWTKEAIKEAKIEYKQTIMRIK